MQVREIKRIKDLLRSKGLQLTIVFANVNYAITLNGNIKVEDTSSGLQLKWFQAFGNRTLEDVFNNLKIEMVILIAKDKEFTFSTIHEALRYIESYS